MKRKTDPLGRGRPPHRPTNVIRSRVRLFRAFFSWSHERIAGLVGVNVKTLRVHYADDLLPKNQALTAVMADIVLGIDRKAAEGNVTAMRLVRELVEQASMAGSVAAGGGIEKLGKRATAALSTEMAGAAR